MNLAPLGCHPKVGLEIHRATLRSRVGSRCSGSPLLIHSCAERSSDGHHRLRRGLRNVRVGLLLDLRSWLGQMFDQAVAQVRDRVARGLPDGQAAVADDLRLGQVVLVTCAVRACRPYQVSDVINSAGKARADGWLRKLRTGCC